MKTPISQQDIDAMASLLDIVPARQDSAWIWQMSNETSGQSQTVIIHGYFELHGCSHFLLFEPDEVIFLRVEEKMISSMVIGKHCTGSMFAPINRELLRIDPELLDPAVLMSAMQMSIAESILS